MAYIVYLVAAVAVFGFTTALWRGLSKGLSRSAKGQQITRFAVGSLLAVLPSAVAGPPAFSLNVVLMGVVAVCWMLAFPLFDFVANRRSKLEIDNRMEFACGLYLFGFLTSSYYALTAVFPSWLTVIDTLYAAVEIPLIIAYLFQVAYFAIYKSSVDHDGLKLVLDTNVNEVLEFVRSFPVWAVICGLVALVLFVILWFFWNIAYEIQPEGLHLLNISAEILFSVVLGSLMFKGRKAAFRRSGLPGIYYDNIEYARQMADYDAHRSSRIEELKISSPLMKTEDHGVRKGKTFILVIGESASRDYMEAFTPTDANRHTTPWLSAMAGNTSRVFLFSNAYSCHFQTVPTLERALTAMSQYNSLRFVSAPSIVDAAHALGIKVYWFSNQGHIGQNDTPVTLVAENADYAKWTSQRLNHQPYDGEMVKLLPEINVSEDKLLVFHLMGSHFTYSNRYPPAHEYFPTHGGADYVAAYRNSIRYTDSFLKAVYDYASENLNLQAMVYCSDHADIPDRRRSPSFDGFGQVRIPLAVMLSDSYVSENPEVAAALSTNTMKPFSNDLLFDLMAGLWRVESPVLDKSLSLASSSYRLTPETTFVHLNSLAVSADPNFNRV